jgi:hypothetical protein
MDPEMLAVDPQVLLLLPVHAPPIGTGRNTGSCAHSVGEGNVLGGLQKVKPGCRDAPLAFLLHPSFPV